jgi:RimJ/RimL family protein N-acetyltransferase
MRERLITIRKADSDDIAFVMSVEGLPGYADLVGEWSHGQHESKLMDSDYVYLLALSDGKPIGFAIFKGFEDVMGNLCLHRIAVAKTGAGVGTLFIAELLDWAFAIPVVDRLWLDVLPDNAVARRVYGKLGFVEEGVMRSALRYPNGRRADLLLMSLLRGEWTAGANRYPSPAGAAVSANHANNHVAQESR